MDFIDPQVCRLVPSWPATLRRLLSALVFPAYLVDSSPSSQPVHLPPFPQPLTSLCALTLPPSHPLPHTYHSSGFSRTQSVSYQCGSTAPRPRSLAALLSPSNLGAEWWNQLSSGLEHSGGFSETLAFLCPPAKSHRACRPQACGP